MTDRFTACVVAALCTVGWTLVLTLWAAYK
jgi:hypothetical protein